MKLHTSACTYTSRGQAGGLILVPFIGRKEVRVALLGEGGFQHTEEFKSRPELLVDEPGRKVVRVNPRLYLRDAKEPSQDYDHVLELEVRRDFPGLLVTSITTSVVGHKKGYEFWSEMRAGPYYVGSDGKRYEWHPGYADIGPQGWIYMPSTLPAATGYGVVTNGTMGEYLGNGILIFTKPGTTWT